MAERLGDAVLELRTDSTGLRRGLRTAERGAGRLNSAFKTVAASVAAAFSVRAIVNFGRELVNLSSEAEETANKFNVVFGGSAAGARAELEDLTATIPLTLSQMQAMAAGVQDLLVPMGVVREEAAGMSVDILQLAGDIASFNNVDATQVLDAIRSGLAGSSEPLLRFGIDTRVASLEALAFEQGLIGVGEELNSTARAQAVMLAIQRDSTDAMGDAARTVDSTANSMRFFGRESRELREELGTLLLPAVGELAGAMADVTANIRAFAATDEGQQFAKDFGEAIGDVAEASVDLFDILQDLRPLIGAVFSAFEGEIGKLRGLANVVAFLSAQFENVFRTLGIVRDEVVRVSSIRGGLSGLFPTDAELRVAELTNEELLAMGENARDTSGAAGELEDRLKALAAAGDAARVRLEALRKQHEANLDAIQDNLEIQENFSEAIKMSTEEMASQESATKLLKDALDDIEVPDAIDLFGPPEVQRQGAQQFSALLEAVASDVGRSLAQAIISGDVESAIDAFSRALEAAAADAISRAVASALEGDSAGALAGGFFGAFVGILGAAISAFTDDDVGRRLEGEVTIGRGGVTTPPDFEQASRQTREAFQALEDSIIQSMADLQDTLRFVIPNTFEDVILDIQAQVIDGQRRFRVGFIETDIREDREVFEATFDTLEEATGFALREFAIALIDQGVEFDSAVREFIQGFGEGLELDEIPFENFQGQLARVQQLADQAAMSLDGVTEIQLALQRIGPQAQALTRELTNLGLSASETTRLVGGQVVQQLRSLRQQITGEELSIEARRQAQRANAQLFNAERALRIADLKVRRADLEAQLNLSKAEIELIRNSVLGYTEALKAKGEVLDAEVKLIIDQIKAINEIIDAIGTIPEIDLGSLRLPGVPRVGIPGIRDVGGGIRDLGDASDEAAREIERAIDRIRGSIESLRQFRAGLLAGPGSALPFGQQLLVAQREFARQQRLARATGEVGDFQGAAQALLDLARQGFGSTAGFQGIFQDILEATDSLERDLGGQLDDLLKPPAEETAMNTQEIAETNQRIRQNTERTTSAVERVENETGLMNERNQVGHGKTQFEIRESDAKMRKRIEDQTRAFVKAIERIRIA